MRHIRNSTTRDNLEAPHTIAIPQGRWTVQEVARWRRKVKWIEDNNLQEDWEEFKQRNLPVLKLIDIFCQSRGGERI